MKLIKLSQDKFARVDDSDFEFLNQWKWYAARSTRTFYAQRYVTLAEGGGTTIMMYRALLGPKSGEEVDHRDGDGLNNQRHNLRKVTVLQNRKNRTRKSEGCSSKYKGVGWSKSASAWWAKINVDGRRIHLGYFHEEEDAARKYDEAALLHHREFATTNFRLL